MILHNGKEYARVSDILRPFSDYSHIDPNVLQAKCDIGTKVHQAIADLIKGDFPCPGQKGVGYFESYERWNNIIRPKVICSEERYFNEEKMITGQIDALMLLPGDDVPVLVDFKTSANEAETWIMQAHLYGYLVEKTGKAISPRYVFLKLNKYGLAPTVFQYRFCKNILRKCLNAIDMFWNNKK